MRELKFRFWNGNTKEMHQQEDTWDNFPLCGENECFLQYTGIKSKNGVEIYEGDIVTDRLYETGVIMFGDYMAGGQDYYAQNAYGFYLQEYKDGKMLSEDDTESLREKYEVIGNIYENPELLINEQ